MGTEGAGACDCSSVALSVLQWESPSGKEGVWGARDDVASLVCPVRLTACVLEWMMSCGAFRSAGRGVSGRSSP